MARDERRSNTSIHMPGLTAGVKSTKISFNSQSHCDEIDEKRQGSSQFRFPLTTSGSSCLDVGTGLADFDTSSWAARRPRFGFDA